MTPEAKLKAVRDFEDEVHKMIEMEHADNRGKMFRTTAVFAKASYWMGVLYAFSPELYRIAPRYGKAVMVQPSENPYEKKDEIPSIQEAWVTVPLKKS